MLFVRLIGSHFHEVDCAVVSGSILKAAAKFRAQLFLRSRPLFLNLITAGVRALEFLSVALARRRFRPGRISTGYFSLPQVPKLAIDLVSALLGLRFLSLMNSRVAEEVFFKARIFPKGWSTSFSAQ